MAGTFSKSSLPKRPGAYFNFKARKLEPTLVPSSGTIAVGATHSWGPENQVVQLDSWGDFLRVFSQGGTVPPAYTAAYRAVRNAFKGEGIPGYGGAGRVFFYRLAQGATPASHAYSNGTTNAITLTGVYKGTYGNQISAQVIASPSDPGASDDLIISIGGAEVERYTYARTNITDLAAQINGTTPYGPAQKSDWVVASAVTSGTALTAVTASLTGGDDGLTLTPTTYSNAQTALEPYRFSVLTFDNLSDATALTALKAWARNLNAGGKRFVTVVGGAAGESMATAVTRSASFADPNFVNVGGGTFTDDDYGDLSTAQLTSRIAGIIAQRGEAAEITFARLAGLEVKVGNSEADIVSALDGGVVAISRDSNPDAPVRLELGITTYTDDTNQSMPLSIYSQIKFIRILHGIETDVTEWAESNVIGRLPVNDSTREYVRGQIEARMSAREIAQIIQPGWRVEISQDPPPSPTDTFVALDYEVTFERGLQQILNTVTVG